MPSVSGATEWYAHRARRADQAGDAVKTTIEARMGFTDPNGS